MHEILKFLNSVKIQGRGLSGLTGWAGAAKAVELVIDHE